MYKQAKQTSAASHVSALECFEDVARELAPLGHTNYSNGVKSVSLGLYREAMVAISRHWQYDASVGDAVCCRQAVYYC